MCVGGGGERLRAAAGCKEAGSARVLRLLCSGKQRAIACSLCHRFIAAVSNRVGVDLLLYASDG